MEKTPDLEKIQRSNASVSVQDVPWFSKVIRDALHKHSRLSIYIYSWIIFFLISAFNLYEYLLRVFPSIMSFEMMYSFQINATMFGYLSAYFYFIYAPLQLWVGILMDRYGPHHLLPITAFICALGAFLFANAQGIWLAQIGRACMGFGSAFAFVGGVKFLMTRFNSRRFGFLIGLLVSVCLLGGILGQVVLASLLKIWSWRSICYGIAFFGGLLSILMFCTTYFHSSIITLEKSQFSNWLSIFSELRGLLKNPKVWLIASMGCLLYLPTSVFAELWGISYLKVGFGLSNLHAAYVVSMIFLGWAIGCPLMGWISDYFSIHKTLIVLGAFFSFILLFILLILPISFRSNLPWFMFGLGFFGSTQMQVISLMRYQVAFQNVSTAIAFLNMFVLLGGFLFQPLIGMLLDKFWQGSLVDGIRFYSGNDYQIALLLLPAALLLGIFICLFFLSEQKFEVKKH